MSKIDRIKVSAEFPGLWLAAEVPIASDENEIEEFKKTRQLLIDAYKDMVEPRFVNVKEALEGVFSSQPPKKEINIAAERVAILIENADTIEELATYKDDATKYAMNHQYMDKLRQLTNLNHKP